MSTTPSHRDNVERVFVTDVVSARLSLHPAGPASSFVTRLEQALEGLNVPLEVIASDETDRWPQDQIEVGFHSRPGPTGELAERVALSSPRNRRLMGEMAKAIPRAGLGLFRPVTQGATDSDSFGNLEAFPPTEAHPFGRIYYGTESVHAQLRGFFESQRQGNHPQGPPLVIDTSWLAVGRVDALQRELRADGVVVHTSSATMLALRIATRSPVKATSPEANASALPQESAQQLNQGIEQLRQDFGLPGAAVCV